MAARLDPIQILLVSKIDDAQFTQEDDEIIASLDVDIDLVIESLLSSKASSSQQVCLDKLEIAYICRKARNLLLEEASLLELEQPVRIVGDLHGQYEDLLTIFKSCGAPGNTKFLFLGNYINRAMHGLETMLLLLCYKIKCPEAIFLLRGNHEDANMGKQYGFYDECCRRSSGSVWHEFVQVFSALPVAAVIGGIVDPLSVSAVCVML
eukprot:jgi/Hompol1/683/HPOL_002519-RA